MERRDALDAISECAFVADVYRTRLDRSQTLRGLPQIFFALAQDRDVRAVLEREPGRGFADSGRASKKVVVIGGSAWPWLRRFRKSLRSQPLFSSQATWQTLGAHSAIPGRQERPPYGIVLAAALIKMNRPTLPTCGTPKLHTG